MRNTVKKALCLVLVLSIIACFAACGGKESIAGKYTIYGMEMEGMTIEGDTLAAYLDVLGGEMYIELYDDGTGVMSAMGIVADMTYADGKIWPTDQPDSKTDLIVEGDTLTVEVEGNKMIFKK